MRTISSRTDHWISTPKIMYGVVRAYGVSTWDMPDGPRLRREMSRSSTFEDLKHLKRWARKYKVDATRQIAEWEALENELKKNLQSPEL